MAALIALAVSTLMLIASAAAEAKSGPYIVTVTKVTDCGKQGPDEFSITVDAKELEDHSNEFNGVANLPSDFSDDKQMKITVFRVQDDGSKKEVHKFDFKKMCSDVKNLMKDNFEKVTSYFKLENECPIKANKFDVKELKLAIKPSMPPTAPYGEYTALVNVFDGDITKGCIDVEFLIRPQ